MAAATGGDPTANTSIFSPHLAAAILAQPECVASVWPAFNDLRAVAHATKVARLRLVVSALIAEARLVFGVCLSLARGTPVPSACAATRPRAALHQWISTLLVHGPPLLRSAWHWSCEQCQFLHAQLSLVVAPAPWSVVPILTAPFDRGRLAWPPTAWPFPAALCAYFPRHKRRRSVVACIGPLCRPA